MSLVSNLFLLLIAAALLVYYLVPDRFKWMVLLLFSYLYYIAGGVRYVLFILYSTIVIYLFARLIEKKREGGASQKVLKRLAAAGLICNLGMLGAVKYTAFFVENINHIPGISLPVPWILFPLGISFYTFQSCGYLLDVYWERTKAERNIFKFALFVSFFPQLMQGPIGNFEKLQPQLLAPHRFDAGNMAMGLARMVRGFAKKMIIADWAGVFVDAIFGDPDRFAGAAVAAVILYGIQLYADFSGAMDVVIGTAQLFGITLDENFKRPYLAISLTDFWKRWHITLGQWMKNYVFYPLTLSGFMKKISKWSRSRFGKKIGRVVPVAIADVIVFLLVGVWHGPSWKYVVYGLYNGLIIAFSELMAGSYRSARERLHLTGREGWYHLFMILRTYVIVQFSFFFDRADSLGHGLQMIRLAFTHFDWSTLLQVSAGKEGTAYAPWALLTIGIGCLVMVIIGVLEERGVKVREKLLALPLPAACLIYVALLTTIGLFGLTGVPRGFIYAQF